MKKCIFAATLAVLLSGCATPYQPGFIYSNIDIPIDVRDNATACTKKGESSMTNILGWFSFGDAGIAKAKQNAGITKVGSVDVHFTSILGLFGSSTTTVCGE